MDIPNIEVGLGSLITSSSLSRLMVRMSAANVRSVGSSPALGKALPFICNMSLYYIGAVTRLCPNCTGSGSSGDKRTSLLTMWDMNLNLTRVKQMNYKIETFGTMSIVITVNILSTYAP